MRMADIKPGWTVVGNDGRPVGTIREVGQNYILTSPAWLTKDIYVPASAIANVEHESVHLSISQPNVAQMAWEQPPRDEDVVDMRPNYDDQAYEPEVMLGQTSLRAATLTTFDLLHGQEDVAKDLTDIELPARGDRLVRVPVEVQRSGRGGAGVSAFGSGACALATPVNATTRIEIAARIVTPTA